jgi:AraC-like DNA-binding protein
MENFKRRLTLADVSEHIRLSESHFSRKFLSETGKNFKQYLNELRFAYAEKLLVYSDLTVMQICAECGFEDYPNFIRRFGENCGMSPSEYRKSRHRDIIGNALDINFTKL